MNNLAKAFAIIILTTASFASFAATRVNSAPQGEHDMGTISTSIDGADPQVLHNKLAAEAAEKGAKSYQIIDTMGENNLSGSAEMYK